MRLLLVKEQKETRAMLSFLIENHLGMKVLEVANAQAAVDLVERDTSGFDLVVLDDRIENMSLLTKLSALGSYTERVFVLRDPKQTPTLRLPGVIGGSIDPAWAARDLQQIMASLPRDAETDSAADPQGEDHLYCRMSPGLIRSDGPLAFDIFLRMSSTKYLKIFRRGTVVKAAEVRDFLERKKIESLYILKSESAQLLANLMVEVSIQLKKEKLTAPKAAQVATHVQQTVGDLARALGFTPEIQELAKQGIQATMKVIGRSPRLSNLMRTLVVDKDKYVASHSLQIAQIACGLAAAVDWGSETTFQKLSFASFFHDIMFTNQRLAGLATLSELEAHAMEFKASEIEQFKHHPIEIAHTVSQFKEVPSDVDAILLQHHERPDGTGFPRHLHGAQIAPLAAIFIVAHDLVQHVMRHGNGNLDRFIDEYRNRCNTGHFRKILDAVEKLKI